MVRVVDLPTEVSGNLTSNSNFVLVSGVSVGTHGTARVALGELSSFYNNVGALNDSGVTALVDSAYIFNIINNSPAGSVTNTAPAFSSITTTPTSRDGYGILDVPRYSDISVTQNNPSSVASTLTYNGNGSFTFTPLSAADSFGELTNIPTTISGYGITDAMTASAITTAIDSAIQTKDNTDEMTEGSTNLYHTTARARTSISATGSLSYNSGTGVVSFTQGNTDTVSEGSTNLYYTDARVTSRITGSTLNMGSNDVITTGKSLYANMYSTEGNLPSAATYHGMFAHVHGTGKGYFSHGGAWHKLIDETNLSTQVDSAYVIARSAPGVDSATIIDTITDERYVRRNDTTSGNIETLTGSIYVTQDVRADGDITAFYSASDRSLKENIEVIDNAIDKVMTLSGYTFNYIGREEKMSGVMADEVESVLPEVVYKFDGDLKAVRYGNMMGLIIEAIKDLKSDINELKEKVNGN